MDKKIFNPTYMRIPRWQVKKYGEGGPIRNIMSIICPPSVGIGLTDLPKGGGGGGGGTPGNPGSAILGIT